MRFAAKGRITMAERYDVNERELGSLTGDPNEMDARIEGLYMKFLQQNCDRCKNQGGSCMLGIRPAIAGALKAGERPNLSCANKR